eukprot:908453-Pleurochrysis_carterae.AAC.1
MLPFSSERLEHHACVGGTTGSNRAAGEGGPSSGWQRSSVNNHGNTVRFSPLGGVRASVGADSFARRSARRVA